MVAKEAGMITIDVKPDLSRFREASADEIAETIGHKPCSHADCVVLAEQLLKHFVILPR